MALHAVLSAFRQIVLDELGLPETASEREALYSRLFPGLSGPEVQDLAQMSPARLAIYTSSVFSAEGNILKNAFPLTLATIESSWPKEWGEHSGRALAQRIHKAAPWRGIHSMTLGESLQAFVERERVEHFVSLPWLSEAALLEQAMLEIRRAPNELIGPQTEAELDFFSTRNVSELLEQQVYVPSLVRGVELSFDLLAARKELLATGKLVVPIKLSQRLVGARPKDYGVQFVALPHEVHSLMVKSRGEVIPLSSIAEAFLTSSEDSEKSEDEVFRIFYSAIRSLIAVGALSICPAGGRAPAATAGQ